MKPEPWWGITHHGFHLVNADQEFHKVLLNGRVVGFIKRTTTQHYFIRFQKHPVWGNSTVSHGNRVMAETLLAHCVIEGAGDAHNAFIRGNV